MINFVIFVSRKIMVKDNKDCGGARYNSLFKNSLKEFPLISIIMPNFKEKNISKGLLILF